MTTEVSILISEAVISIHKKYCHELNISLNDIIEHIEFIETMKVNEMIDKGYTHEKIHNLYQPRMIVTLYETEKHYKMMYDKLVRT